MANNIPNTDLRVEISNKQILRIALPIALAMLVPQINFVANTVFLSGLGETELGVAGITGVYYLVFALVGNGLNSGLQALIARRAGETGHRKSEKCFLNQSGSPFFLRWEVLSLPILSLPGFLLQY